MRMLEFSSGTRILSGTGSEISTLDPKSVAHIVRVEPVNMYITAIH